MSPTDKPLVWLSGEVKTPPFSAAARVERGWLLRRLQRGEKFGLPHARPMPAVGRRCLELRVRDRNRNWRILLRVDDDAVVIAEVFEKKTRTTPTKVLETSRDRLRHYDESFRG